MKIVVYDLETKNSPVTKDDWKNWAWMGISVGCAYDFSTGEYSVFLDDNLQALVDLLNSADMIAAFNHVSFDNNLLRGVGQAMKLERQLDRDDDLFNYDMLVESRAGAKVDMYAKGFKLDAHLKATLGPSAMKTGDGAGAPALYRAGKMGQLVSYCLADVHRERLLFEWIWETGRVSCEHGTHAVKTPQEVLCVPGDIKIEDLRNMVPGPYGPPMHIGVDSGAPDGDRTVQVQLCQHCGYLHAHGTPHIEPKLEEPPRILPDVKAIMDAPLATTNPEDL